MERFFNTEGPVRPAMHYSIPPLDRVDLDEILTLIEREKYFVLHAPRQTGKTSTLKALAETLSSAGKYCCVYVNVEAAQTAGESVGRAMRSVLSNLAERAELMLHDGFVRSVWMGLLERHGGESALYVTLSRWARAANKPLVVLIDEIDVLRGDSLLAVLRQLRAGYDQRPHSFPQSVVLCGVRDVRDYVVYSTSAGGKTNTGSAFNIKAKSLRLGDFTEGEMRRLFGQHTAETGQEFEPSATERVWELTGGQPWLVNALAYQACFEDKAGRDRSQPVSGRAVNIAKEKLILERVTHLDQLGAALSEERVRRVIMPLLAGSTHWKWSARDLEFVRDIGLVARTGPVRIADPIYAEVVPRELSHALQSGLENLIEPHWYVNPDGGLNIPDLLAAFQSYFRDHSESWVDRYGHREAGPQLVLHAYLQRVANSGGRIEREYGLGRRRTDRLVTWPVPDGREERYVIECKVVGPKRGLETVVAEGARQTAAYVDHAGADEGHLIVFDLRKDRRWSQRLFRRDETVAEQTIGVWGA